MNEDVKSGLGCFLLAIAAVLAIGLSLVRMAEGDPPPDQTIVIDEPDAVVGSASHQPGQPRLAEAAHPRLRAGDQPGRDVAGAKGLPLSTVITICRTSFFVDPARGRAMFEAVATDDKAITAALCLAYRQGAEDMARAMAAEQESSS